MTNKPHVDLEKVRERHENTPDGWCFICGSNPPCDATQLADEVERLRKDNAYLHDNLRGVVSPEDEEITRLTEALGFYGNEGSWENDHADVGSTTVPVPYTAPIFSDCGQIARAALPKK